MQIINNKVELVSVVMPALNQARFIERAIRSVLSQQGISIELIIMDGGSTDGTLNLLNNMAQEAKGRLRYVSETDHGPAHATNKAMAMASGSIIGWLNSDDVYKPWAIERAVQALKDNPQWMMVYGHGQHIDAFDQVIDSYPTRRPNVPIQAFADGCFICQPTAFLRRDTVLELGPLDDNLKTAFDLEWWLRLFSRHPDRVGFVDAVQAQSRLHEDCITLCQSETAMRESMQIVSRYLGICPIPWFKSFVTEVLYKNSNEPELTEPMANLKMFVDSISEHLSESNQREINYWLKQKLNKAQLTEQPDTKFRATHSKFTATVRRLFDTNTFSSRNYTQISKQIELIK